MKLIWTKSKLPLSLLIQWGLKEPVSHFAIVFDDKIVFQSNLLGTGIKWKNTFEKHCEIVYEIEYKLPLKKEEEVYQAILNQYDDKPYDFPAFFYFIYRGLLKRYLGKPMPEVNKWDKGGTYLCTQLAASLPLWLVPSVQTIKDLGMTSPYVLYQTIKASKE